MDINQFPDLYKQILFYCSSRDLLAFAGCCSTTRKFVDTVCDGLWKHFYYRDYKQDFVALLQDPISITVRYWDKTAHQTRLEDKRTVSLFHNDNVRLVHTKA